MLPQNFIDCITEQLKEAGFGKKRTEKLLARVDGLTEGFKAEGMSESSAFGKASEQLFNELKRARAEKYMGHMITVQRTADGVKRIKAAFGKKASRLALDGGSSEAILMGHMVKSMIDEDPRAPGISFVGEERVWRETFVSKLAESAEHYGKGFIGQTKNEADAGSIIRALYDDFSGTPEGVAAARSFRDVNDFAIKTFQKSGGAVDARARYLPDPMNDKYKILQAKNDGTLLQLIKENADISAMRRADGRPLPPDGPELDKILLEAADAKISDGLTKEATGRSYAYSSSKGNKTGKHRFFVWKDAAAYEKMYKQFSASPMFDLLVQNLNHWAEDVASVRVFGRNPRVTLDGVVAAGEKMAFERAGPRGVEDFNKVINDRVEPMFRTAVEHSVANYDNTTSAVYGTIKNLIMASALKSVSFVAIPADQANAILMRHLNKTARTSGILDLVKYAPMITGEKGRRLLANYNYINSSMIETFRDASKAHVFSEVGPKWSRAILGAEMRLNGMTYLTENARQVNRLGTLADLAERLEDNFDIIPSNKVMERYGISSEDWNAFRSNVTAKAPEGHPDARLINISDILETELPNKLDLYSKFQNYVVQESYNAIPDASLEASVILKGTSRPNNMKGVILDSFSMFKNQAFAMVALHGRQLYASGAKPMKKATYLGALATMLTLVGATRLQLQEVIVNGRTPREMDADFWIRAMVSGGAFYVLGDVALGSADSVKGRGLADMVAGPAIMAGAQASNLAFSDWVNWYNGDLSAEEMGRKKLHQMVELTQRFTPSLFYTHLAVQKLVFDNLDALADPQGHASRARQREALQRRNKGNQPLQFK